MHIIIKQPDLKRLLATAIKAVPSRPTHPILGNLLLIAKEDKLTVIGFDLTLGIKTTADCQVEKEGIVTVPAKIFSDIINKSPDGEVELEWDKDTEIVTINAHGRYEIRGISADEYPELPTFTPELSDSLPVELFSKAIKATANIASNDETKPILTGVQLKVDNESLTLSATNGHILGIMRLDKPESDSDYEVVIPSRVLKDVNAIVTDKDESITLSFESSLVSFKHQNTELISRLLNGTYPNCKQLIPASFSSEAIIDRQALIQTVERVTVFADEKNNMVKFNFTDSEVKVASEASQLGNAQSTIPCEYEGDFLIGFNSKYLLEGLKNITSKEVKIAMNNPEQPVIITPLSGDNYTFLIMPVRIKE